MKHRININFALLTLAFLINQNTLAEELEDERESSEEKTEDDESEVYKAPELKINKDYSVGVSYSFSYYSNHLVSDNILVGFRKSSGDFSEQKGYGLALGFGIPNDTIEIDYVEKWNVDASQYIIAKIFYFMNGFLFNYDFSVSLHAINAQLASSEAIIETETQVIEPAFALSYPLKMIEGITIQLQSSLGYLYPIGGKLSGTAGEDVYESLEKWQKKTGIISQISIGAWKDF